MRKYLFALVVIAISIFTLMPSATVKAAQIYTNSDYKISLNYSGLNMQASIVSSYIPIQSSFEDPQATNLLTLYLKPSIYKGTNLEAAAINIAASKAYNNTSCYTYTINGEAGLYNKIRKVQGNSWHYGLPNPGGGVAAGHSAATETYRLYKNNTCYEAILQTSDFNRYNLDNPNSVFPYSSKKVFNRLGAVFNQLKVR